MAGLDVHIPRRRRDDSTRFDLPAVSILCGLLLAISGLLGNPANAQSDSTRARLEAQLAKAEGDARIETLIDLANELTTRDFDQCRARASEAMRLARAAGDSVRTGRALLALSRGHTLAGEVDVGLDLGLQALQLAEDNDDEKFQGRALNTVGTILQRLRRYQDAAMYYERSLALARRNEDRFDEARNLNSLGVNSWYEENYEKSLMYYTRSLKVQQEIGDRLGEAAALNNIAMVHHVREEIPQAIDYYEQSLQIKREIGYTAGLAATLGNLGELCLSEERYPQALSYLTQSRDLAGTLNASEILLNSYYSLADYYSAVGDHETALQQYKLASEKEKEVFSARSSAAIAEIQTKYETAAKNHEIDRLSLVNAQVSAAFAAESRARDRLLVFLLLAGALLLALAWLYRQQRSAHRRVRAQAEELELAAAKIETLTELLPICASCKNIRDEGGQWHSLEAYLQRHADLSFTHGICPKCSAEVLARAEAEN